MDRRDSIAGGFGDLALLARCLGLGEAPAGVAAVVDPRYEIDEYLELARYRGEVEAVTIESIQKAALDHIHMDRIAIVAVGDADAVGDELRAADYGELEIIAEDVPAGGGDDGGEGESE